jgi:PKD repeat protein
MLVLGALTMASLTMASLAIAPPIQARGVVSRIALEPTSTTVSSPVTATATGTNPCGAVFIDWGDGTAVTYAISSLPATQTHAYASAGQYAVIAKGMGNCDGETRTAIAVKGPASPPPAGEPAITSVDLTPSPAVIRRPVDVAVKGHGTCAFSVDFGDGNSQDESGPLPRTVKHTYAAADTYVVIVRPSAPCGGKFTQKLQVGTEAPASQITGVNVSSGRPVAGQPVTLDITGTGVCRYTIDFGDGNADTRSHQLPDRIRHNYPAPDVYTVSAAAEAPCTGTVHATLNVRRRR